MNKLVIVLLIISCFGCKDNPRERVLIRGKTVYINHLTGEVVEEANEWSWKECEIIEKSNGLWKVKELTDEVTRPISWINPRKLIIKTINSEDIAIPTYPDYVKLDRDLLVNVYQISGTMHYNSVIKKGTTVCFKETKYASTNP